MVQQRVHLLLPDQWKNCGGLWTPVWSLWSWSACRNQHRGSTAENRLKIHNQSTAMLAFNTGSPGMQKKQWSYRWSRVELGDNMVEEGCEVGRARLELLNAVKAVALAVWLSRYNIVKIIIFGIFMLDIRFIRICLLRYDDYLLLVWIKIIILSSNDLWDDAGDGGTAEGGRGKRVLGVEKTVSHYEMLFTLPHFWREMLAATRSVVSSASGEWQELRLFLGVLFGLGKDDSFG